MARSGRTPLAAMMSLKKKGEEVVAGRVLLWGTRLDCWVLRRIHGEVLAMLVALMTKADPEQYASDSCHRLFALLLL